VFGGAGWVLFHKQASEFEVYNDQNENLVNLYRCVREKPEALVSELEYVLNSRADFTILKEKMKIPGSLTDVKRAAVFYQLVRYSYASGLRSFGGAPHSIWDDFPAIRECCVRLQRVVVENKDFEDLIRIYDRPDMFFFCDPPYFDAENYYKNVSFTGVDHERLKNALLSINGMFLLSYNDCPEIISLYSVPGIMIESVSRLSNIAQRYEGGKKYAELLIANYDTTINPYYQLTFPDLLGGGPCAESLTIERKVIYRG
jgi:DNA adenine methylase